jgi:hypothetical protein
MNWITRAIGAGNAALLEMFQHKIVTMHQDLTNQNTNLLSRINFLEIRKLKTSECKSESLAREFELLNAYCKNLDRQWKPQIYEANNR